MADATFVALSGVAAGGGGAADATFVESDMEPWGMAAAGAEAASAGGEAGAAIEGAGAF